MFTEEEVLGWTSKEALAVIHPNDVLGFKVKMAKALLGKFKNAFTYDYRAIKSDGTYAMVRIIATGVQQPDKSFMVITDYIILDI